MKKDSFDKLLDEHHKEGLRRFGRRRWDTANVGRDVGFDYITTKVYGPPDIEYVTTERTASGYVHYTHEKVKP